MQEVTKKYITEKDRKEILKWALESREKLNPNGVSPGRFYERLDKLETPAVVNKIIDKIKKDFSMEFEETNLGHFLSFNETGASIHPHSDMVSDGYSQHIRFNIVIQKPEAGGDSVQGDSVVELENGMLFKILASGEPHSSTPVVGELPRITLSFGFQEK
jgi:hypothetical protein